MSRPIHHPLLARVYDPVTAIGDRLFLARHRFALASGVSGNVLDLGSGTGKMVPHLRTATRPDSTLTIHSLEPDPAMRTRAAERALGRHNADSLVGGVGEQLPYQDDTFDVVIAGMVFCTVDDPPRVLDEVCRVLRPGGEFRALEHIRSSGPDRHVQRISRPLWSVLSGGCRPDRRTDQLFLDHPDLQLGSITHVQTGLPPIRPFIRARLRYVPAGNS